MMFDLTCSAVIIDAVKAFMTISIGGYVLIFVLLPLLLAIRESINERGQQELSERLASSNSSMPSTPRFPNSRLCVGRVWHTRFHPKRHSFTYPIFMFALDLEEVETSSSSFQNYFSPILQFQPHIHHLKNREGLKSNDENTSESSLSLADRICNLIAIKTQKKFQPTSTSHRVILLTHLQYYGYNFNPVSFYYIHNKSTGVVDAMVGEVSNTPWTEMYCYVLHPDSIDQVQCSSSTEEDTTTSKEVGSSSSSSSSSSRKYRFPKEFHVSPFMEMDYWYDWIFQDSPHTTTTTNTHHNNSLVESQDFVVVNSLRKRSREERMDFTATLKLKAIPMTPFQVAWQIIRFPIFCMMIQIWIHYQAAWLFLKGVVYIPHPTGSETAASKAIATIMVPFFAIRDYLQKAKSTKSSSSTMKKKNQSKLN